MMVLGKEVRREPCLEPDYVAKFRCDGTTCGSKCCCRYWSIFVDDASYQRIRSEAPEPQRGRILERIGAVEEHVQDEAGGRRSLGHRIRFEEGKIHLNQ
jgi:hypothetical protein